jgi:hypothetical protein
VGQLTSLISGKLVAFDTGPLIYYIEEHPDYLSRADELFSALDSTQYHLRKRVGLHGQLGQPAIILLAHVLLCYFPTCAGFFRDPNWQEV